MNTSDRGGRNRDMLERNKKPHYDVSVKCLHLVNSGFQPHVYVLTLGILSSGKDVFVKVTGQDCLLGIKE